MSEPQAPAEKPASRLPAYLLAALTALVVLATGNLSGVGIGNAGLLYDTIALPRFVATVVLTLATWAAWLFVERQERVRLNRTAFALIALAVWGLVSTALSPHRALALLGQSERLEGAVTLVMYAAVYVIALQALRSAREMRLFVVVLVACSTLLSVLGLLQYAGIDPTNYVYEPYAFDMRRAFATLGNPNFLAGLLVLALPLAAALGITGERRLAQSAWVVSAIVIVCAIFATFTRGAWLAVVLEIVLGAFVWLRSARAPMSRRVVLSIAAGVLVLAAMAILSLRAPAEINVATRLLEAFRQTGSASERSLLVNIALASAAARPLVGYGPDTFLTAFRLHRSEAYVDVFHSYGIVNNAHSWPLQYAATLGFVGALLLLAVLVTAFWGSRAAILRPAKSEAGVLRAALWISCFGYALYLMMSVSVLAATIPFFIALGALGASTALARKSTPANSRSRLVLALVCAALSLCALGVGVSFVYADAMYLQARIESRAGDYRGSLESARRARAANPLSVKYARGVAEASGQMVVIAVKQGASPDTVRAAYADALKEYERTLRVDPNDYPSLAWLAALQARVANYLSDEDMRARYLETVERAAALDVHHAEVAPLINVPSEASINAADAVPRLP